MPSQSGVEAALAPAATSPAAQPDTYRSDRDHTRPRHPRPQHDAEGDRAAKESPDPNRTSDTYRLATPVSDLF